jgi:hypothetical protein
MNGGVVGKLLPEESGFITTEDLFGWYHSS